MNTLENAPAYETALPSMARVRTKLNSLWLERTYPFAGFGRKVSIHYSCDIRRSVSPGIRLGDEVYMAPEVWMNVIPDSENADSKAEPKIVIGNGCSIGRRCTILAKNRIVLEDDVLLAPSVLIVDHSREFASPTDGERQALSGTVSIGRNCWLGIGAVISCSSGALHLGRNCVVGANAVVTRSFPPFSVIAGNPAKVIKVYDQENKKWIKPGEHGWGKQNEQYA
jgi:acetyltransferase-like isoleucine patch superfamily enzyme